MAAGSKKPRHSKNQKCRNKLKRDLCPAATAKFKEDSHKKHLKVDHANKAVKAKIQEFEALCRPKADSLQQQSA